MNRLALFLFAALALAMPLYAAEYQLANGSVQFEVPNDWPQIMQKTEGDPQFRVFQVRNPDARGTLARVSVKVRLLATSDSFDAFLQQQSAKSAADQSFAALPDHAPDKGKLRFSTEDAGQRLLHAIDYIHRGNLAITVSCVRPADAPASEAWLAAYRLGCASLAAELAR